MSELQRIDPKTLSGNVYEMMEEQWALLTAGKPGDLNTMTVGWGTLGCLWGRPVAIVYVRPQRYTYEFMEREDAFTLSFFGEEYRKQLQICGTESGRDVDKVKKCGLTPAFAACGAPYFEEARLVLACKKLYAEDMKPESFTDPALRDKWYPQRDYHRVYVGEIVEALQK